jgi:hypothetical protein
MSTTVNAIVCVTIFYDRGIAAMKILGNEIAGDAFLQAVVLAISEESWFCFGRLSFFVYLVDSRPT